MRSLYHKYLALPGYWRRQSGLPVLFAFIATTLLLAGCSTGAYSKDFFQEMHYQQSYRIQEAPAGLSPSASAVSFVGLGSDTTLESPPPYDYLPVDQLQAMTGTPLADSAVVRERGEMLFARNCQVCHGADGTGAGIMRAFWAEANPPADLTSVQTQSRTDGEIFAIITHGTGTVPDYPELTNMPSFRKLLSMHDRWALVHHIRALQGQ